MDFASSASPRRRVAAKPHYDRDDETGMVFEGFLLFFDPLKEDIETTVRELERLGVAVKIVTGDNRHVAAHVGAAVGLDAVTNPHRRQELNEMREEALWHLAEQTDVCSSRSIRSRRSGSCARCSTAAMPSPIWATASTMRPPCMPPTSASRSNRRSTSRARAADIVLLERDLGVLRDGIVDGRRTFVNTLKYVAITTSANFGNMISMAFATLFVPFLPLLAKQILLNNFLSDFPSVATFDRQRRPGGRRSGAALGYSGNSDFHAGLRAHQHGVRFSDIRFAAGVLSGRRGTVPDRPGSSCRC